ncbi:MAG: hypothetical protein GC134_05135 [Proteobacteria bacterium]|nr:hypothetical protein [Pseudomonadota bacterium]
MDLQRLGSGLDIGTRTDDRGAKTSSPAAELARALESNKPKDDPVPVKKSYKIEDLPRGFDLEHALGAAYDQASRFMNGILNRDGLNVQVTKTEDGSHVGQVVDTQNGRMIKEYQGLDVLRFYAGGTREKGLVVDGKV